LLDLFCGAGGCTKGYQEAGFHVVGVDLKPQPNYCGDEFVEGDAIELMERWSIVRGSGFDAIHASPPCQAYSVANNIHGRTDHPELIPATRELLQATGLPYVIENVPRAPLINPITLCGLSFGLNVKRHRLFECNFPVMTYPCPQGHPGDWLLVFGHTVLERGHEIGRTAKGGPRIRRKHTTTDRGREAMGIDWMTRDELSQAIPPAYTAHIGSYLLSHLEHLQTESRAAA
jgi:DNA (cytosine-5)-methyltransferase 1